MDKRYNLTSVFLQQSLEDSEDDFKRALNNPSFPHFDVIALTASNEHQAESFRSQLAVRDLPPQTEFVVIPDINGERIGSGGATLNVIKYVREKYGSLKGLRIACIHSGGDGRRTPNYSALGKLFSPVPRILPNGKPSTLFDEYMISISSVPGRMQEGLLLLSGDVLLMFNPLQIDFSGQDAAAISFKEDVETSRNHGVFLRGEDGYVRRFLHKQSASTLSELGAVDERNNCSIDTGAVIFSSEMIEKLYSLVSDDEGVRKYINTKTRLSLYGDFLYPLADDSTLEAFYSEKPEGEFCSELTEARKAVWNILSSYRLKLLNLAPAKFIHFGTTKEIMALMNKGYSEYELLGWSNIINSSVNDSVAGYNSVLSDGAKVGKNCYLEVSYVHSKAQIGNNCLLSYIDIHNEIIPDNVVMHGLKQLNGKFVCRIYGINDNPKEDIIFGRKLSETGLSDSRSLWDAELYPECDNIVEAVAASLNLYKLVMGDGGDYESWKNAVRKSLCSGFNDADSQAVIDWNVRMEDIVRMEELSKLIDEGIPASEVGSIFKGNRLTKIQENWLKRKLAQFDINNIKDFSKAIRLNWYLGVALDDEEYQNKCFKTVSQSVLEAALNDSEYNRHAKIANEKTVVKLPLRINWGGGWTDTPPYCLENGGTVLNAAVSLNGEYPVEVTMIKIKEHKIVFDSRDMDVHGEFDSIEFLQDTGNPFDPFAIQKACLLATGIIPVNGGNLNEILDRLGGGFEMHSEVTNVPKGSGLGTSSILSAACVKAVYEFWGIEYTDDKIFSCVLAMEQIMSTGGGWQDQVGGVSKGIKFITSDPGLNQVVDVEHVTISDETKKELDERLCLIYTGQRRLARNLLRDVVGRYVGNTPESIYAHKEIRNVAQQMKASLERGDIDEFAGLLDYHWKLSKMIDEGTTNTLLEHIFVAVEDLIDGRFVSGAGGGGFIQVILKKGISKESVQERLKEVFQDFNVDVWNCRIEY